MRIAIVSNFVIRQKHIEKMIQIGAWSEEISVDYYRIYGKIDEISIAPDAQYDGLFLWICFSEMFPGYSEFLFSAYREQETFFLRCISQLVGLCEKGTKFGKNVWIMTMEDWRSPLWEVVNPIQFSEGFFQRINRCLINSLRDRCPQVGIIDCNYVAVRTGIENLRGGKENRRWGIPYTDVYIENMFREMSKAYEFSQKRQIKCIVLDCDNVLWGGILSENGSEKIILGNVGKGKLYAEFQEFIRIMRHAGYILAVSSKNDEKDIDRMFREHSGMVLKKDDIAVFEVNWGSKVDSIRRIVQFLNIGMNSVLFIDDSESEVGMVKSMLPEVSTVVFDLETIYEDLSFLLVDFQTNQEMVKDRMASFRSQKERYAIRAKMTDSRELMKELKLEVSFTLASELEINRIAELTRKTNKFNYGKRYSQSELFTLWVQKKIELYSIYVKDRFCNHGLVGAIGISSDNRVEIYCLSCRVLGYGVEEEMFQFTRQKGGSEDDITRIMEDVGENKICGGS